MIFNRDDPNTWPVFRPPIIAHDVGRSRDRSTAVVGGLGPFEPSLIGIQEAEELPQGLYGSARASALAAIDRRYYSNALIVADLSNDATYAEVLHETFGPRVIGLQITRHGDGMNAERRPVKHGSMLVYTVGRSYLLEAYHSLLQSGQVRIVDGPTMRRATSSSWRLRPKSVRAGSSILARQGITMISAYPAPCWRGRRAINIYPIGPTPLCPRAGRADRRLQNLVRWAGHNYLSDDCAA
jgi:hypothetical protein